MQTLSGAVAPSWGSDAPRGHLTMSADILGYDTLWKSTLASHGRRQGSCYHPAMRTEVPIVPLLRNPALGLGCV